MSRGLLPPLLATLMGVGIGVYTFQPIWEEHLQKEREQRIKQEADIGPNMVEVPVQQLSKQEETNTSINSDGQTKG